MSVPTTTLSRHGALVSCSDFMDMLRRLISRRIIIIIIIIIMASRTDSLVLNLSVPIGLLLSLTRHQTTWT